MHALGCHKEYAYIRKRGKLICIELGECCWQIDFLEGRMCVCCPCRATVCIGCGMQGAWVSVYM